MVDNLLIVLVNTDPYNPPEAASPFFQAAVAAAMEYAVEVLLMANTAQLAKKGIADRISIHEGGGTTLYDLIQDAHEAGVIFKLCEPTLHIHEDELIPEIEEVVGTAYMIQAAMNDDTVTFTY